MAAPAIPPTRLRLVGTGPLVEKPRRPALRRLAHRYGPHCGDITRVRAATSTVDAPSGSSTGNHTASNPEVPVPPEPDDSRLYGTGGVLAGSESERPAVVFGGLPAQRISSSASFAA